MVYFYQLFLSTDDVILRLYTSLCQKAKCTLFVWSTVPVEAHQPRTFEFLNRSFRNKVVVNRSYINECLAILAESGSKTTSEALKIQNFPGGACPQSPLVGACFARTFYIDTSTSAINCLYTYLLPTPLKR